MTANLLNCFSRIQFVPLPEHPNSVGVAFSMCKVVNGVGLSQLAETHIQSKHGGERDGLGRALAPHEQVHDEQDRTDRALNRTASRLVQASMRTYTR